MITAAILIALACSVVTSGASVRDEMCGSSVCLANTTCCNWESGSACCGYANAVCCSDGNCCPSGTTCDDGTGRCDSQDGGSVASSRTSIQEIIVPPVENVVCQGGQSECPSSNTCCKIQDGSWGCCPLAQAACCSDMVHCCPNGYTCDTGGCLKTSDMNLIWSVKTLLQHKQN